MQNNYAFIDGQNLDKSIKSQNWKLDYRKFRDLLAKHYNIKKAFYFIGYLPKYKKLYKELRRAGFRLVLKNPVIYKNGKIKANVDSDLTAHAVIKKSYYDKAIIVTGDGDYYFLAKYLLRNNKLLQLLMPSRNKSAKIYKNNRFRNYINYISKMKSKLEKQKDRR